MRSGKTYQLVDPTKDKLYIARKKKCASQSLNIEAKMSIGDTEAPILGWNKNLGNLPHLDDLAIYEYTKKTGKSKNDKSGIRPEQRGYAFFDEGYIHIYTVCSKGDKYFIHARCYRNQRKGETPHKLWLCVAGPGVVEKANCSCKAGFDHH